MQSAHCQMRIRQALENRDGIKIQDIEPGVLSISLENDIQQNEVLFAIENVGHLIQRIEFTANSITDSEPSSFQSNYR